MATIYCGGRPPPLECDGTKDGAGADESGGLLLDPDDELLLEFNEEFELEEEELDDEEESDEPDPEGELGQAGLLVLIYENWLRTVAGLETLS